MLVKVLTVKVLTLRPLLGCRFELLKDHSPKALRLRTRYLYTIDEAVMGALVPWVTLSAPGPVAGMVLGCKTFFFSKSKVCVTISAPPTAIQLVRVEDVSASRSISAGSRRRPR